MHIYCLKKFSGRSAIALSALLLALWAPPAFAKEYETVNAPPPMPEAMRSMGQASAARSAGVQSAVPVKEQWRTPLNDEKVTVSEAAGGDVGFALPDSSGGYVWTPAPAGSIPAAYADARELKLKVRELAAQLVADMDPALRCMVALPTSFVSQEDFSQSSPLGRFMAEQLMYEFNQRGFQVKEYRMAPSITPREGQGEFVLTRKVSPVSVKGANTLVVAGTYFADRQAVFINARLLRGNGAVLRTAQIVLPASSMTRRMVAGGNGKTLKKGTLPIQDFKTTTRPTNLTPFDLGEDIH